jgi:hypothetical protein
VKVVGKFFTFSLQATISLIPYLFISMLQNKIDDSISYLFTVMLIFNVILYISFLFHDSTLFRRVRFRSIKKITSKLIFAATSMLILQSIFYSSGFDSKNLQIVTGVLYFGLMFSALFTLTLPEDQADQ